MQGYCAICDDWCLELIECPICGDAVGPSCFSFRRRCCLYCKAEFDEDPE
jgi:hypothetical protein